ncbi:rRNA biogenesis protein rrp5 [Diplogelasinospora grovesii]|uniref:rRNA biogenesis protein RRP5 n=1 Tax=Diplogelasinospora grovesii TaxID=303347 RepID=A0AAN6MZX5_9PEZI|nr:rRNA biogenesis protein rrp5 [Diplogelasinospora grovesii]
MSSLKRKEVPDSASVPKSKKQTTESRPSKRPKSNETGKDEGKTGSKQAKPAALKPALTTVVSRLKEEEPLFPRGGGSVLSPLEHKQIQIQARNDVLFEQESSKAGKKKGDDAAAKKKKRKSISEKKDNAAKPARDEDAVKVESLNFKRLVKGSLVLGCVCAINSLDIALALPNNLVGHVPITAISDALTKRLEASAVQDEEDDTSDYEDDKDDKDVDLKSLFRIGDYVRAHVVSTVDESSPAAPGKAKRHIELSLEPSHANSGMSEQDVVENCTLMASVASVEDHGFVMDIGVSGSALRGFLPRKQVDKDVLAEERLQPGSVLLCIVTGKNASGKVVQLSALGDKLGSTGSHPSAATTIDTFLPGTVADVLVSEVSQHGIVGKVMGSLDVTADLVHSGAGPDGVDLEEKYKVGSRLRARVICNFPTAKKPKLGISVLPHVVSLKSKTVNKEEGQATSPLEVLPHSAMAERCTVQRVEPDIGLYVDVGIEGVSGFVHISRVKDGKVDALFEHSGPFKVGSVHPGRVVGYSAFDSLFLLSFEKTILEQPFLRIEDIPVGAVVSGVVEKLVIKPDGVGGLIVKIAEGISGLVPEMHLADVHLQHPEKKFREGLKVKARVLSTNPERHQLRLTLKKSLVNSEAPPIKSYDEVTVGLQAPGTIVSVLQHGAIVQFYGQLRGFLPVSEMSEAYIHDPKEHFRVGQSVSIYVLSFDPDANRLIVSCKDPAAFGLEKQLALKKLQVGDVVSAKVTQKTETDVFVELSDSSLKAILPVGQLTDKSVSKTQSALKKIHVGQTLSELVILDKNEGRRSIILSQKPSLVKAGREAKLLSSIEQARVGDMVAGFVRHITYTAAFVQFAGKLTALLPKSKIPRDMQDKPDFGLHKTQSLLVKITAIDRELGRLVVAIPSDADEDVKKSAKLSEQAVNSLDESISSVDDLSIGKRAKAMVVSVKDTQLNVKLADNIQGRVDVSQAFDAWDDMPNPKKPLEQFKPKQMVEVRVLGIHDARNHRFLPISHRSSHSVLELSMKPSDLKEDALPEPLSLEKTKVGSTYLGFVNNVAKSHLWVNLSPNVRGRISAMDASDDLSQLQNLQKSFPIGSALRVRVLGVDAESKRLDLSARSSDSANELNWDKVEQNMVLPGKVTKVNDRQIMVKLSESLAGPVHMADLADDYDEANPLKYSKDEIIRVAVVGVDKSSKRIRLSTRPSRVLNSSLPVKDKEVTKATKLEVGDVIRGFVKNVSDKGLFVTLGGDVTAYAQIKNLSDSYLKEWKEHFQVDQLVKGRITSVADGRIEMSLKPSVVDKDYVPLITISDLKEGQVVTGKVRKVEEFGAFIEIDGSANLSGLCHRSEMADKLVKDARTLYNEGDVVKARVLKVDAKQKRINFGLKPSYFDEDEDDDMEDAGTALEGGEEDDSDEEMSDAGGVEIITGVEGEDDDEDEEDDASSDDDEPKRGPRAEEEEEGLTGLDAGGFDWSAGAMHVDAADVPSNDATEKSSKKIRKNREPQIHVDKTAQLDVEGPQTASDFERLLLGQPDSSELWLRYMAFQMQVSELAGARQIAERAIKTINIREEGEKLNVWTAYLNLEVEFGTEESVEDVFKRACTYNDEQEVHERLTSIYIRAHKHKEADALFEKMLKKFGSKSANVWINYATFLHTTLASPDRARNLLKRATQALGSGASTGAVYLALMPKFAALEFRSPNGDREQGRTLFENLLAMYPKKFDLWNQLVDLETSSPSSSAGKADTTVIRDLFERGSKVKGLKPRQAKAWFKRWAQWEDQNGDAKSREKVSAKALEWAAARKKAAESKDDEEDEGEE